MIRPVTGFRSRILVMSTLLSLGGCNLGYDSTQIELDTGASSDPVTDEGLDDEGRLDADDTLEVDVAADPSTDEEDPSDDLLDTSPDGEPDLPDDPEEDGDADTADFVDEEPVVFVPNEVEPNDETPQRIELPATIHGRINEPRDNPDGDPIADVDTFVFSAPARTVIRLTFEQCAIEPYLVLWEVDGRTGTQRILSGQTPGLTREAFLPVEGDYLLMIVDYTNLSGGSVGGEDFLYSLSIESRSWEAEPIDLPFDETFDHLPEANGVRIQAMDVVEQQILTVDTDAQVLGSGLDTLLFLMNEDPSSDFLVWNDDDGSSLDSHIRYPVGADGRLLVVTDFYSISDPSAHRLHITQQGPGDIEPNDTLLTASVCLISHPPEVFYPAIQGTIGPPREEGPDVDGYLLGDLAEGDTVEIEVLPGEGSLILPMLTFGTGWEVSSDVPQYRSLADSAGRARIEATAQVSGTYYVFVSDLRNQGDDPDTWLGGDDLTYTLRASESTRIVLPISLPFESDSLWLEQTGDVAWFTFDCPESPEGQTYVRFEGWSPAFEATLSLFQPTEERPVGDLLAQRATSLIATLYSGVTYHLSSYNAGPWTGGGTAPYPVSLTIDPVVVPEVPDILDTNVEPEDWADTEEGAWVVSTADSAYAGSLWGGTPEDFDRDVFVIPMIEGQLLVATTFSNGDPEADTILELVGPGVEEPLVNDDYGGGLFSRLWYSMPPLTEGQVTLTVRPFCSTACSAGAYGLHIAIIDP